MKNKIICYENYSLSNKSPIRVGGVVKRYYEVNDIDELSNLIKELNNTNTPYFVFSNASNMVFKDEYDNEVAIKVTASSYKINDNMLYVESGVKLPYLARILTSLGYSGWSKIADIPGEIGGSIVSNCEANGQAISDTLIEVTLVNNKGEIIIMNKSELQFSYRNSFLKINKGFVLFSAKFTLVKGNKELLKKELEFYHLKRKSHQPVGIKTLGSTFKNPSFCKAYELIDGCNLRGYTVNNIKINEKHCNFLEIVGKTTRKDILDLIAFIKDKVYNKYAIKLEEEIDI